MDIIPFEGFGIARAMEASGIIIIFLKFGIILYGFILFVKLANRGIKLMDIIIDEKKKNKEENDS